MIFKIGLLIISLNSCVPISQQVKDQKNAKLQGYEARSLITSESMMDEVLNPEIDESTFHGNGLTRFQYIDLMQESFQSNFVIVGCENSSIQSNHQNGNLPEILDKNLLISLSYGAGNEINNPLISYKLIWDGKYYFVNGEPNVNVVLSFKDLDMRRGLVIKRVKFNLAPIQHPDYNAVRVNILGCEGSRLIFAY